MKNWGIARLRNELIEVHSTFAYCKHVVRGRDKKINLTLL